jgi:putative ABC transport system substrate-binding protein
MRELLPNADLFALLIDPKMGSSAESQADDTEAAGRAVGQRLIVLRASTEREIDAAFATLVQQRAAALLVATSPFFVTRAHYLMTLAARHSLPAMYFRREFVEAGGLMSYVTSTAESYRQLGNYAGKILSGFKPADLPVKGAAGGLADLDHVRRGRAPWPSSDRRVLSACSPKR